MLKQNGSLMVGRVLVNFKIIYMKQVKVLLRSILKSRFVNLEKIKFGHKMSGVEKNSPNVMSESVGGTKRLLENEDDEDFVKRIQLDPVGNECEVGDEATQRRKLRKFVLLLSYCGKDYLGMQRNPGFKTIEDDLLMAMLKGDLIKEEGVTCPQIYKFQRAARTDKGVSAARQIVSVKLPGDVDIPQCINKHLTEEIRVWRAVRVTQKFDAKNQCDSRSYSYLTPTFAFAPEKSLTDENYRITKEVLEELRHILGLYKGTHNFHNFTARVKAHEQKANRYIMDINCSDPFVRDGIEWTLIKVKGQSFMLHQIRKMVGLAVAISRGYVTKEIFKSVWKRDRRDIPIAPGLGLVLEEPHYEYYNKKYSQDGMHETLEWSSEEEKIQSFREKFIDSVIVDTELREKSMITWLETLDYHTFGVRTDGPPKQMIPKEETDFTEPEVSTSPISENNSTPSEGKSNLLNGNHSNPVNNIKEFHGES